MEVRGWRFEVGGSRLEVEGWRFEVGGWRLEQVERTGEVDRVYEGILLEGRDLCNFMKTGIAIDNKTQQ